MPNYRTSTLIYFGKKIPGGTSLLRGVSFLENFQGGTVIRLQKNVPPGLRKRGEKKKKKRKKEK